MTTTMTSPPPPPPGLPTTLRSGVKFVVHTAAAHREAIREGEKRKQAQV
jgi:hypothetical protein